MRWEGSSVDWTTLAGEGGRPADEVPGLVAAAFGPASPDADHALTGLRALLVGEGAYTAAGARIVGPLLALATGGAGHRAFAVALDVLWGELRFDARGIDPALVPAGAGEETVAAARAREPALVTALGSDDAEVRAGAALVLGALRTGADAVRDALAREDHDGVRAALILAAREAREDELASRSPVVRLAAAVATVAALGDDAPELALVTVPALADVREDPRWYALPARLSSLGLDVVLGGPRGRRAARAVLLPRIDAALARPEPDVAWVAGELGRLLAAHLPPPPIDPAALDDGAREVLARTLGAAARKVPVERYGLPRTPYERRRWLDPASAPPEGGLRRLEEASLDGAWNLGLAKPTLDDLLAAIDAEPDALEWARGALDRRERWPGASRAPNGPLTLAALLVIARADPADIERRWVFDHEPLLAALTVDPCPAVLEVLRALPGPRRAAAWREHVDVHANARVGLARGIALAAACPSKEVAADLVARAIRVAAGGGKVDVAALGAALAAMGEEAAPARAALGLLDPLRTTSTT